MNKGGKQLLDEVPEPVELSSAGDPELMAEFIAESYEAIEAAEAALLDLETAPRNLEAVNVVFRSFHTIKGTSSFLGLETVSQLAHHAEHLLSRIREHEIVCAGGFADLALASVDILKELLHGLQDASGDRQSPLPYGYRQLIDALEDPEAHGISEEFPETDLPPTARLGDILVSQGKAVREEVEAVAAAQPDVPLGLALVRSSIAKVSDVARALRSQIRARGAAEASMRVPNDRMQRLFDLVGELAVEHSALAENRRWLDPADLEAVGRMNRIDCIVQKLQELCRSLRLVALAPLFQRLSRLARDLSRQLGKQVEFVAEGEGAEIDRNIADLISDPLMHMVRNAVDHGIELPQERVAQGKPSQGKIRLRAGHLDGHLRVDLQDDGRGIDRKKVAAKATEKGLIDSDEGLSDQDVFELIFAPGFSMAEELTDVSGRGVGMDVVRRNVETLQGRIQVDSVPGRGCTISLLIPLKPLNSTHDDSCRPQEDSEPEDVILEECR